ncbi:MAG: phosphate ABC transporter permease PstA [Bdellovibrionota bacterium]
MKALISPQQRRAKIYARIFVTASFAILGLSFLVLILLFADLLTKGLPRLSMAFLTSFPSRFADQAGILSAWVGSLCIVILCLLFAIPVGIGAAVYLEEYMNKSWYANQIEISLGNLAGVPSIIYGLMALGFFVYQLGLGHSVLTAGLTLSLLVLPIVIVSARESLRSVPDNLKEAAYALGASKLQMIRHHQLPYAQSGIFTGVILSLSRALGETAPLLTIGALTFIAFLPQTPIQPDFPFVNFNWLMDPFTVLPIQLFNWTSRPQAEFHQNAAAASLILVTLTVLLNLTAIILRNRSRRKYQW